MRPQQRSGADRPPALSGVAVGIALALACMGATASRAATLAGTVRDADTLAPLAGVDLDVFDATFAPVLVTTLTAADGTYQLFLPASGAYYVRCDPSVTMPYVDQFYPGVLLKSQAATVSVPPVGTTTVNFDLQRGGTISGHVFDQDTNAPLAGVDLDVFDAPTQEFIGSINTASDPTGAYTLGAFPAGTYLLRAQPAPALFHQARFFNNRLDKATAFPVAVVGLGNVPNIDFHLPPAGSISGTIHKGDAPAQVLGKIDMDLYDSAWVFQSSIDGLSDAQTGVYVLGAIPPGQYYVRADPTVLDRYVTTYWPNSYVQGPPAQLITVTGNATAVADFTVAHGGTISGRVTDASTGAPILNARLTVFQSAVNDIVFGVGASTDVAGNYEAGVLLPGSYMVRVTPPAGSDRAYQFWNGPVLWSLATPITVTAGQQINNIRLQLAGGGTISGTVRHAGSASPVAGADLDVFASGNDEFIGALDAKTDAGGNYVLHAVPAGTYKVKTSHPSAPQSTIQYWNHSASKATATPVGVVALGTVSAVDFDVQTLSEAGRPPQTAAVSFDAPRPNPFGRTTRLGLSLARSAQVDAVVYDLAGRRVRTLSGPRPLVAGVHEFVWDGHDARGSLAASGIYWLRVQVDGRPTTWKLIHVRP